MFGLSLWMVLPALALTAIGSSVQGSMGFGVGMLTSPFLQMIDGDFVPGAVLLAVVPLSFGVAVRERRSIDWPAFRWAIALRIPGIVAGSWALGHLSERGLSLAVGAAVLTGVAASLTRLHIRPTHPNLGIAGLFSGFMGTVTSVGGPPMAIAYQHGDPRVRQATLAAFFGVGSVLSATTLAIDGKLSGHQWQLASIMLPGVAIGILTSRWIVEHVDARRARPIILAMSAASAIVLIVRQL